MNDRGVNLRHQAFRTQCAQQQNGTSESSFAAGPLHSRALRNTALLATPVRWPKSFPACYYTQKVFRGAQILAIQLRDVIRGVRVRGKGVASESDPSTRQLIGGPTCLSLLLLFPSRHVWTQIAYLRCGASSTALGIRDFTAGFPTTFRCPTGAAT